MVDKKLIQLVREGKIAIYFDDKTKLELLRTVLQTAFPESKRSISVVKGNCDYYFKHPHFSNTWQNRLTDLDVTLPLLSIKYFVHDEKTNPLTAGYKFSVLQGQFNRRATEWDINSPDRVDSIVYKNRLSFGCVVVDNKLYVMIDHPFATVNFWMYRFSDIIQLCPSKAKTNEPKVSGQIFEYQVKDEFQHASKAVHELAPVDAKGEWGRFDYDSLTKTYYEELGVLDIWFTAIAKKYKLGDWVVVKNFRQAGEGNGVVHENLVTQLQNVNTQQFPSGCLSKDSDFSVDENGKLKNIKVDHIIRFATDDEIKISQIKEFDISGKFKVTVQNNNVYHASSNITNFVLELGKFYSNLPTSFGGFKCHVSTIKFKVTGCQTNETDLADWLKVYNIIKPL